MIIEKNLTYGGLIVGIYLFSVPVFSYSIAMGLSFVPRILAGVVVIYAIISMILRRGFRRNTIMIIYLLFAIWCLVPYTFSRNPYNTDDLFTTIQIAILSVSIATIINSEKDFFVCISFLFCSIILVVLLNFDAIRSLERIKIYSEGDRFAGTLQNANMAALYALSVIWSGVLLLAIKKRNWIIRSIIIFGILIAGYLIVYSGSRKGIFGLVFFAFVVAYILIRLGKTDTSRKWVFLLAPIGLVAILYLIIKSPFFLRFESLLSGEQSSINRMFLFNEAIGAWNNSVKNLIVGVGVGNFEQMNSLKAYSHSTVSEALVCTGIIGFLLYFTSIISLFLLFFNGYGSLNDRSKIMSILILGFIFLFLFFNFFAVMFSDRLFWPIIGIISSYGIILRNSSSMNVMPD